MSDDEESLSDESQPPDMDPVKKEEDESDYDISSSSESDGGESEGGQPQDSYLEEERAITYQEMQSMSWGVEYHRCPRWSEEYDKTQDPTSDWPEGIQMLAGRMFKDGILCIPLSLQEPWIRDMHSFAGHFGAEKLWHHLEKKY